jgi:hypothetical protein
MQKARRLSTGLSGATPTRKKIVPGLSARMVSVSLSISGTKVSASAQTSCLSVDAVEAASSVIHVNAFESHASKIRVDATAVGHEINVFTKTITRAERERQQAIAQAAAYAATKKRLQAMYKNVSELDGNAGFMAQTLAGKWVVLDVNGMQRR